MSPRAKFANEFIKGAKSNDIFSQPKYMVKRQKLEGDRKERMKQWITFFRRNPHRFVDSYFGIKLFPYQVLMLWVLQRSNLAYIVAARATAKTWIIGVWALCLAVLYPGIKIIVCAKTLKQGGIIISDKIKSLMDTYSNVNREIEGITTNPNNYEVKFYCGSSIKVVPSSESARNNRANYIIIEEARLVPKEILEQVIKPFLFSRMPPYRLNEPYRDDPALQEEGIISYITSAWYKAEYWYTYVRSCIKRMADGDETANFLAFDYLLTIYHGIKTIEMIKNEMADNDTIGVQLEYYNIPSGQSGKGYFKPTLFKRTTKKAFYPQKDDNYNQKKNPYDIPKLEGELRMVSIDVATRANKVNDQTIISCMRLIPLKGKGYERTLIYMESHKGENTLVQALRIKEVFYDFEADFVTLDLANSGIGIFDSLSQATNCDERGITFPAFTVVGNEYEFIDDKVREELENRTLGLGAVQVIFPVVATQILNSQIAVAFRTSLRKKLWNFLIPEGDGEEFLVRNNKEFIEDPEDSMTYAFFINPYVQTSLFIAECLNLDMSLSGGNVKLEEKSGCYKDRYSSVSYANWIVSKFDISLLKETEELDEWDIIQRVTLVL